MHFRNEYALRLLKIMNQANILEVEELILDWLNLHTLEEIVNSVHFNYNIKIIRYRSNMCSLLSDKILKNISKIQPQKLELSELSLFPNWIRILSNLPSNITTSFGMLCINDLALKFLDTFVYFKSNEEFTNLHWREINFWYEKINNNDDIMHLEGNNLWLYNFNKMSISNFEIEINSLNLSPKFSNLINSEVNNFIFIPLNNLSEIWVSVNILQKLFDRSNSKIWFSEIPRTSKWIIKIYSIEEIVLFDKISSFVPKNSELEINAVIYNLNKHFNKLNIKKPNS